MSHRLAWMGLKIWVRDGTFQNSFLHLETQGYACTSRGGNVRGILRPYSGLSQTCEPSGMRSLYIQSSRVRTPSQVPADVEKCQDRMECFNADLKADMERWQNNKRQDFRQLLVGMADKNIQYYEKVKSPPLKETAVLP